MPDKGHQYISQFCIMMLLGPGEVSVLLLGMIIPFPLVPPCLGWILSSSGREARSGITDDEKVLSITEGEMTSRGGGVADRVEEAGKGGMA